MMPEITPKSLERVGSKIPRNIISSNRGAKIVVVTNNRKKESLFNKNLNSFIEGFVDSKYQRGY